MTTCRSVEDVRAAALDDAKDDEPLTQDQADLVAAIRQPHQDGRTAA